MKFTVMSGALAAAIYVLVTAGPAHAYVYPTFGGGQNPGSMIMPEVFFDGTNMHVFTEAGNPWPMFAWNDARILRPLVLPDAFDGNEPWKVLIHKAYNLEYGWDASFWANPLPGGCEVWMKVLTQTPGLETYYADDQYKPIFGTAGSSNIWLWDKQMHHNAYAVPEGIYGRWSATYEVYVGNAVTGAKVAPWGSATVTLRWMTPCPWILSGDINSDCITDFYDFTVLAAQWFNACTGPDWCDNVDTNHSGKVDFKDVIGITTNWLIDCEATPGNTACVPR